MTDPFEGGIHLPDIFIVNSISFKASLSLSRRPQSRHADVVGTRDELRNILIKF